MNRFYSSVKKKGFYLLNVSFKVYWYTFTFYIIPHFSSPEPKAHMTLQYRRASVSIFTNCSCRQGVGGVGGPIILLFIQIA